MNKKLATIGATIIRRRVFLAALIGAFLLLASASIARASEPPTQSGIIGGCVPGDCIAGCFAGVIHDGIIIVSQPIASEACFSDGNFGSNSL